MDTNNLQDLLDRYRSGNITDDEMARLEELSGRDEVMAGATHRARTLRRRRLLGGIAAVGAIALVATVGLHQMRPTPTQDTKPVIAKVIAEPETVAEPEPESTPIPEAKPATAPKADIKSSEPTLLASKPTTAPAAINTATVIEPEPDIRVEHPALPDEPTVLCNTQCDADSVINEIWKFLKA